jgi:hypothetical protein
LLFPFICIFSLMALPPPPMGRCICCRDGSMEAVASCFVLAVICRSFQPRLQFRETVRLTS